MQGPPQRCPERAACGFSSHALKSALADILRCPEEKGPDRGRAVERTFPYRAKGRSVVECIERLADPDAVVSQPVPFAPDNTLPEQGKLGLVHAVHPALHRQPY